MDAPPPYNFFCLSYIANTADTAVASVFKLTLDVSSLLDEYPAALKTRLPGKLPGHQVEHLVKLALAKFFVSFIIFLDI